MRYIPKLRLGNAIDWLKGSFINPQNLGVKDYTNKGDFNTAYSSARHAGEKEFMFNNKRYNTNYKGTPQQQLKETGITDKQLQNQNFVKNRLSNNLYPYSYENKVSRVFDAVVLNKKDPNRVSMDNNTTERTNPLPFGALLGKIDDSTDKRRIDAFNIYVGKPQSNNTFEISKYKPSINKDNNAEYYKIKDEAFTNNIINNLQRYKDVIDYISNLDIHDTEIEDLQEKIKGLKDNNLTISGLSRTRKDNAYHDKLYNELTYLFSKDDNIGDIKTNLTKINNYNTRTKGVSTSGSDIMGNFSVSFGKDDKGEYASYYDKWDLEPVDFGKPFEIYDRIYVKDYGDGQKKRMYYSDKELSELDINKKNFDTLALQRELSNRGYKLSKSTKKDNTFDGVWGDETKKALLDYQKKSFLNNKRTKKLTGDQFTFKYGGSILKLRLGNTIIQQSDNTRATPRLLYKQPIQQLNTPQDFAKAAEQKGTTVTGSLINLGGKPTEKKSSYWDFWGGRLSTNLNQLGNLGMGVAKTVGASAALATGMAYTPTTVGTLGALGKGLLSGAVIDQGYSLLGGRFANIEEIGLGAAATMGIPLIGKLAPSLIKKGVKSTGRFIDYKLMPERPLTEAEVRLKNIKLNRDGILPEQKTLNMPYKNFINKTVRPWTYDIDEKILSMKKYLKNEINPSYIDPKDYESAYNQYVKINKEFGSSSKSFENWKSNLSLDQTTKNERGLINLNFKNRFKEPVFYKGLKNRAATWDMYLGLPQKEYPIYKVSPFSTTKKTIYTIKPGFTDAPPESMLEYLNKKLISRNNKPFTLTRPADNIFGTMGGHNVTSKRLPNGNMESIMNDVWDLHPFKDSNPVINRLEQNKFIKPFLKPIKNIEVGKALGIGKPLDVRVGFEYNPQTGQIVRNFEQGGELTQNNKE